MKTFEQFMSDINHPEHEQKLQSLFDWIVTTYPHLKMEFKWNQPMFTDHGTFILGFSTAKNHFSVAPEGHSMDVFDKAIGQAGYERTKMLFKIKWNQDINYDLFKEIIDYNIKTKQETTTFWR
jgi:uncharacterized protein YdhG (YjbR/CyaY superfamily)